MYQNNQNQNQQGMNFGAQQNQAPQQNAQNQNSGKSSNRTVVPEAKGALNQMKYEIASELGINLKQGYNGDLPSRQAGYIGGYMTNPLLPGRRFLFPRYDAIGRDIHKLEYYVQIQVV